MIKANLVKQHSDDVYLETKDSYELTNETDKKLIQRTQMRFLTQELRKQKNLEQIFDKTEKTLEN